MRRAQRQVTDWQEIERVLEECKVCRFGWNDKGRVYIVPVNFGYSTVDGKLNLYFHGAGEGRKIELVKEQPYVGFEMDCGQGLMKGNKACQYSYNYASIIGNGYAHIVEDVEEKNRALKCLMYQMTGKEFTEFDENDKLAESVTIVRVSVDEYTCKKYK